MIFFAHPKLLALLAIPVTLAFWEWIRRGQPLVLPVDHCTKRKGYVLRFLVQSLNMLPAVLMAVAIILLARPMVNAPPVVEREVANVQFVLDISGSMADPYGPQPDEGPKYRRFDAAMDAIDKFTTYRQGDAFGLTVYAKPFLHWVPLTQNMSAIRCSRPFIQPFDYGIRGWQPGWSGWEFGGTSTFTALNGAADELGKRPEGDRMVILVTDGLYSEWETSMIPQVLARFQEESITCFGVFIQQDEIPEEERRFCLDTDGELFIVEDEMENTALDTILRRIDQMKKVKMRVREPLALDHYQPLLIPALLILSLHLLSLFGLRFNPW